MTDTINIHTPATDEGFEYAKAYGLHHKKRFSWQPVAAGIAAALAVQVVLGLIGLGIGFSVNPTPGPNALPWRETPSIGALMWAGVSILISLFYGGFIAARLTKSTCHHEGVLSGVVTWAGTLLVVLFLLANSYGGMFGGASQIMGHLGGPHYGNARFAGGPHMPPMPGAPVNAETLNQGELMNPPAVDQTRLTQEREAEAKAALAAGVVLLLAAFTSAIGGVLGAAHVRHHRAHEMLQAKGLV